MVAKGSSKIYVGFTLGAEDPASLNTFPVSVKWIKFLHPPKPARYP